LAWVNSGLVISLALGAPLGLLIGDVTNWRAVFIGLAVVLLLIAPIHAKVWPHNTGRITTGPIDTNERLRRAVPYLVCMLMWSVSVYATYTLLGTALDKEFFTSARETAIAMTCFGAGATSGVILGGKLADRLGARRWIQLCFLLMLISFSVFYIVYQRHLYIALITNLFVIALVAYGFFPAIQACATQTFSTRRPTVLGLMSSALYVGMSLGASIGTRVFEAHGMNAVLLTSLLAALIGWMTSVVLPR